MARKPVTLGERSFATKKEAKELYSKILNETNLGECLEGESYDYVMALLLNHPRADEKIGNGIKSIKVAAAHHSLNRCFHVIRVDDSVEDFSIGKCIDGEHSDFHKFCIACRKSVDKEIKAYKRKFFEKHSNHERKVKCQSSGEWISFEEAHADHREPFTFSAIVHFFYKSKNLNLSAIGYESDGKYGNEFSDSKLADSFRLWHKEHAQLRIVHGKINLKKGYLGRVKPTKADGSV